MDRERSTIEILFPRVSFIFAYPLFFFSPTSAEKETLRKMPWRNHRGTVKNGSALPLAAKFWQIGAAEGRIFKPCEEREGRYEGTVPLLS